MKEEENIIVKWAQEDVETSYNPLNNNNNTRIRPTVVYIQFIFQNT